MATQGNVLQKERFIGAPIERAHLHRGFKSNKTPIKWIKFFRACVLQREIAESKRKRKVKYLWIAFGIMAVIFFFSVILFPFIFVLLIVTFIVNHFINKKFRKNYTDGFDFFADYFSAFFTLIEEDLAPQSRISLDANVKQTVNKEFFIEEQDVPYKGNSFSWRKNNFYEREISTGTFTFSDSSVISFQFTEKTRERVTRKRGNISGKMKTKYKFKSVYPFVLKMKIPKNKYTLKSSINKNDINLTDESEHYILKVRRKFDPKSERPNDYNPYNNQGITTFAVDYFSLEIINLINTCYACVTPKK